MKGKLLKISNNDLYGNVDDRQVALFAAFEHKKYMNKYAIFTYADEYNKNKLYCVGVHLKPNSIVTFSVRDDELNYINKFVTDYLNNQIDPNEFEILDISNVEKIEIISTSSIDSDKLFLLDQISIPKMNVVAEEAPTKKPVALYIVLVVFVLLGVALTYLYLNPDILSQELSKLDCTMTEYDRKLSLPYTSNVTIKFDHNNELKDYTRIDTYQFKELDAYNNFKTIDNISELFPKASDLQFNDDKMTLDISYQNNLIIFSYEDVLRYMKKEGYSCIEGVYNE